MKTSGTRLFSVLTLSALLLTTAPERCPAQESSPQDPAGARSVLNVERKNPLEGLFTPQPQYITPQTILNPEPKAPPAGELNPLKGLFTPQPQYITPQTLVNPSPAPPLGEVNHFKSLYTPENPFQTAASTHTQHPQPRNLIPERLLLWGSEEDRSSLIRQHNMASFGVEDPALIAHPDKAETPKNEKTRDKSISARAPHSTPDRPPDSPLKLSLVLLKSGYPAKALALLNGLLRAHPDNAQAHYLSAVASVQLKRFADAQKEYREAIRVSPSGELKVLCEQGLKKLENQ